MLPWRHSKKARPNAARDNGTESLGSPREHQFFSGVEKSAALKPGTGGKAQHRVVVKGKGPERVRNHGPKTWTRHPRQRIAKGSGFSRGEQGNEHTHRPVADLWHGDHHSGTQKGKVKLGTELRNEKKKHI